MQHNLDFFESFIETPPLWEGLQFGVQQFEFPVLNLRHFKTKPIPENIRLGHQIEHVFKQLLNFDDTHEILLHNVPIRRDKITLGEIDFILKKRDTNKLIHVELTYKFYIIDTSISQPLAQLSGANRLDLFLKKLEKIKTKQFPLLHGPEAAAILKGHHIESKDIHHQVCFKAQLFVPYLTFDSISITLLNNACIIGHWFSIPVFKSEEFLGHDYYIPSKRERVLSPKIGTPWKNYTATLSSLETYMSQKKSVLLWQKRSETDFRKFFVVWW